MELARRAQEEGATFERIECRTREDLYEAVARPPSPDAAGTHVLLLAAHGRRKRQPADNETRSYLLCADMDPEEISGTAVDLDEALQRLRRLVKHAAIVVVDACAVAVRPTRAAGAQMTVVLANPEGEAEESERGGLLSDAIANALVSAGDSTIGAAIDRAINGVISRSGNRQQPVVVHFGDTRHLRDSPWPPRPAASPDSLAAALVDFVNADRLGREKARVLLGALPPPRTGLEREVRGALLAAALPSHEDIDEVRRLSIDASINERTRAHLLHVRGWYAWRTSPGDLDELNEAAGHVQRSLRASRDLGDRRLESQALNTLGYLRREALAFPEAAERFTASLQCKRTLGDTTGIEMTRQALGWLSIARGRFSEARTTFEEGIQSAEGVLDGPAAGKRDTELLLSALRSIASHWIGYCVATALCGFEPRIVARLEGRIRPRLGLYRSLADWLGGWDRDLVAEADAVGRVLLARPGPAARSRETPPPWSHVVDCLSDGPQRIGSLQEYCDSRLPTAALDTRMKLLACFCLVAMKLGGAEVADARNALIKRLRDELHYEGIPDPSSNPWPLQGCTSLEIDTSRWLDWGPLGVKRFSVERPGTFRNTTTTEQYLQLLSWISALIIGVEGAIEPTVIYRELAGICADGDTCMLNLSQSMALAVHVAAVARPSSEWGRSLVELWKTESFLGAGDYATRDECSSERNRVQHNEDISFREAQRVVERQNAVIRTLCEALGQGELPLVETGRAVVRSGDGDLRSALLVNRRGGRLDCGPLLLVRSTDPSEFFVPHSLKKRTVAAGKSEYYRYGRSIGSSAGRVWIRLDDPAWEDASGPPSGIDKLG